MTHFVRITCCLSFFIFMALGCGDVTAADAKLEQKGDSEALSANAGLKIEYGTGPTHADWGPKELLRIEPTAADNPGYRVRAIHVYRVYNEKKNGIEDKEFVVGRARLSKHQIDSILAAVREANFWALETRYSNPQVRDGSYRYIDLIAGKQKHKVVCINTDGPDGFSAVRKAISKLSPLIDADAVKAAAETPDPMEAMQKAHVKDVQGLF